MKQETDSFNKMVITTKDGNRIVFDMNEIRSITYERAVVDEALFESKAVDLGLSVKWAPFNLGADENNMYGNGYTWGSLVSPQKAQHSGMGKSSDEVYDSDRKIYCGNNRSICGSDRDIIRKTYGGKWRMPTANEIKELAEKCTWKVILEDGYYKFIATGPSGKSITFTETYHKNYFGTITYCSIWSGELSDNDDYAYCLSGAHLTVNSTHENNDQIQLSKLKRDILLCVRGVFPNE